MKIIYEPSDPKWGSYRPDARFGNTVLEYKRGIKDVRMLRDSLTQLAMTVGHDPMIYGILLLDEPKISADRIQGEWEGFRSIIRDEITDRLSLFPKYGTEEQSPELFRNSSPLDSSTIHELFHQLQRKDPKKHSRNPDAFSTILKILLLYWFRGLGPVSSSHLGDLADCSYPTIKAAREKLEKYLKEDPRRGVELRRFPESAWTKLLADSEDVRQTRRFVSAAPRPALKNAEKANKLSSVQYAIGGIIGARHHFPGIDLVGEPRLDLIAFQQSDREIEKAISKIDPSLRPAETGQTAQVVIHRLHRRESYFQEDKDGRTVTDEVECLLDLYDARLDQQAQEFLDHLKDTRKS
tara:strand:+ start:2555 stop:3610 length:1056 start_codon:yes stop_codon:yes gene_type:complete